MVALDFPSRLDAAVVRLTDTGPSGGVKMSHDGTLFEGFVFKGLGWRDSGFVKVWGEWTEV